MNRSLRWTVAGTIGGAIFGLTALGVAGVASQVMEDDDLRPMAPDEVPIPTLNSWIEPWSGEFRAYEWDDRRLSDEQKAASPAYDPRWQKFGHCMADEGFEVRDDPNQPFGQDDLDQVVARANAERPDKEANKAIGGNIGQVQGIAGAFLRCAETWLRISYEELGSYGIRPLEPGEVPLP